MSRHSVRVHSASSRAAPAGGTGSAVARSRHVFRAGRTAGRTGRTEAARPQEQLRSRAIGLGKASARTDATRFRRSARCVRCCSGPRRSTGPQSRARVAALADGRKDVEEQVAAAKVHHDDDEEFGLIGHRRELEQVVEGDLEASPIANSTACSRTDACIMSQRLQTTSSER